MEGGVVLHFKVLYRHYFTAFSERILKPTFKNVLIFIFCFTSHYLQRFEENLF